MFRERSNKNELLDDPSLKGQALIENLDEMEIFNRWFGSKKVLVRTMNQIKHKYSDYCNTHKIVMGDLGCGNGDLLRAIAQWAKSNAINAELIGIDTNPMTIQHAKEKSHAYAIKYIVEDIFSPTFSQCPFDIVSLNNVSHHLSDTMLIQLLQHLLKQTRLAIVINDLHRHWLSYFSIKWLSKLFNFSALTKHDAPLSVLRAFRKQELCHLLEKANIQSYQLQWKWIFRWRLLIWCKEQP